MNKPIDLGKPVQTRGGDSARIICTDAAKDHYPVLALVKSGGIESVFSYTPEGRFYVSGGLDPGDLVNIPEKHQRTGWFNFYKDGTACFHPTKPDADRCRGTFCIASVPVTVNFEAGDGL